MTRPPKDARQEMRGAVERWSSQIDDPTELRRILLEATGAKLPGRPAIDDTPALGEMAQRLRDGRAGSISEAARQVAGLIEAARPHMIYALRKRLARKFREIARS